MWGTSINSAYAPWLGEKLSERDTYSIYKFSKIYIGIFSFMSIGIMLLSPEILLILGGKTYLEAKYVMLPVAMSCVCQFLYTMFVNVEQFEKKTIGMAFASVSAAIINYILNYLMIPRFGYIAAAYTTLIGYIWLLIVHMYLVYKMKMGKIYSYKFVISTVIVFGVLILGINYLYANQLSRYFVVLIYFIIFLLLSIKNKRFITMFLKK